LNSAEASARLERRLQFLAGDPQNLPLIAECADLALDLGRAGVAQALVERGLALKPEDPHFRARLASAKLAAGDAGGAIEILEALLKANVDAPELRYNLGYALMLAGRHADAKQVLGEVGMPQAELLRVRAHHHLGEVDEAIKLAEQYATAHPDDAQVIGQLAMLYLDADDFTKARAWADRALTEGKSTPEAYFTAGFIALGDEDEERALELLGKALELNPRSGRAWAGKGLAGMFGGDLAAGEEALERAAQYMPTHIGTWHALAWCQILRGKLDAAEASFRKAYELDRTFAETHGGMAVLEILRGGGSRAQRRTATALKLDPGSFSGQYAQVLLEAQSEQARAEGVRRILAQQQALKGGTLVDLVARQQQRRHKPK
jgi:tetratricopeptide (TPR) repeat protein